MDKDCGSWFCDIDTIHFSPWLTAIIGNKGSGKSALADIFAATAGAQGARYEFLTKKRFLSDRDAKSFRFTLEFFDNSTYEVSAKNFSDRPVAGRCIYLSQQFIEELCDPVDGPDKLQHEIDRVIFDYVPPRERRGKTSLSELVDHMASEYNKIIQHDRDELKEINAHIARLEEWVRPERIERLRREFDERLQHLKEVRRTARPARVEVPQKGVSAASKRSTWYANIRGALKRKRAETSGFLDGVGRELSELEEIEQELKEIERAGETWKARVRGAAVFKRYERLLEPDQILRIAPNWEPLKGVRADIDRLREKNEETIEKIDRVTERAARRKQEIDSGLQRTEQEFQQYCRDRSEYYAHLRRIVGTPEDGENLRWLRDEVRRVKDEYPGELRKLREKRTKISRRIIDGRFAKERKLEEIYAPILERLESVAEEYDIDPQEFVGVRSDVKVGRNLGAEFLDLINRNRSGTYYGVEASEKKIEEFKAMIDPHDPEGWVELAGILEQSLWHNLAADPDKESARYETHPDEVLREGRSPEEAYDYIYGFPYFGATFSLSYSGKSIEELSPGQRGMLILIFYLLVDLDRKPIVIDQPEENLDNETVYRQLVQFIRNEKSSRQIIIVTHNPNLAVVCDAEKIVHAEMVDQVSKKIRYRGGAIEMLKTRDDSVRVLEGTRAAFENRGRKYRVMSGLRG